MDDVGGWVDDQDTCISFKKIINFILLAALGLSCFVQAFSIRDYSLL